MPSRFDVPPEDQIATAFHRLTLERMKFGSRTAIGAHTLSSMRVETWMEPTVDQLFVSLRAEVLAENAGQDDVSLPVAHQTTHTAAVRGAWGFWAGACAVGVAAVAFLSPWAALACAVLLGALTLFADYAGWLTRTERQTWRGTVHVHKNLWRTFPEASTVYPPDLGRPIEYAVMDTPKFTWGDEPNA